ncbi:uncharacterized protein LOC117297881 [Asterias rubens]|uniref:uncharacterized protein LOC117297881 n=1 Tax=Asterias rubens TaxID=7604 RepID=UPI00145522FA|nr:uncharacterized protein LOC117297881 [Asterias rubens]
MKSGKSETSKAGTSQPTILTPARIKHEINLLKAFHAMEEGMSVSEASKQFGFPEESLQVWTVTKIPINQGRPQRSCNQHSVPPTAKRKHMPYDKASLVNAMQATKDGMSALRASKLHGVPVSTLYDWIRRNGTGSTRRDKGRRIDAMNRRKTPKSSKSTPSSNATYKRMHYGKAKLLKAVQATKDGMTICKASKLYGVPASTLRDWITQRSRTKKITPPTASQSARNQYAEVNTVDALKAIHEGSTIFKASRQFDVPKSTLHDKIQGIIRIDSTKHQQSSVHKNVKTPKTQYYNEIKLINAFRAIPDGLTVYKTARQNDIPKSALRLKIKKQPGVQKPTLCDQTIGNVNNDSTKPMVLTYKRKRSTYNQDNLIQAFKLTQEGTRVHQAARQYGIPDSTLRDIVKKQRGVQKSTLCDQTIANVKNDSTKPMVLKAKRQPPMYNQDNLVQAFKLSQEGTSVCQAARQYGIPVSTLRDWITRNVSTQRSQPKQIPPPTASQSARNQYAEVNTVDALKAIHEGSTIFKASWQFNVPKSTLHDKIQGIVRIDSTKHQQSSVRKNVKTPKTQYYNEIKLINAFRAIPDGLTVYKTARQCDAPKSALRLTIKKQRGVQTSSLCDQTKHVGSVKNDSTKPMVLKAKRKRSMYDQDKLVRAFKLTQEGTRVCQAARQYGVPDSTLRDMINKQRGVQKSKLCDQTICNVNNDSTKRKQSSNSMVSTSKRKRCTYDQDNLVQAFKLTQEGTCVHQAARQYGVPVSTLRDMFNKQRGVQKPTLCDQTIINVKNDSTKPMMLTYKRKHSTYNRVDLIQAFQSTQEGTSVYHAARKYGVPDSTLRDMIKRNPIEDASRGQTNIFTRD